MNRIISIIYNIIYVESSILFLLFVLSVAVSFFSMSSVTFLDLVFTAVIYDATDVSLVVITG